MRRRHAPRAKPSKKRAEPKPLPGRVPAPRAGEDGTLIKEKGALLLLSQAEGALVLAGPIVPTLRAAVRKRTQLELPRGTNILRLVHDVADGLPGLYIDRYGSIARIDVHASGWVPHAEQIARVLRQELPELMGVVLAEKRRRGPAALRVVAGEVPRGVLAKEAGATLLIRAREPDAVGAGVFADLRMARALLRARARGGPALNLFAHAGAYGVAAFLGGATRVDHVDAARKCAGWAAVNLALNGAFPRQHRYLVDDAFAVLARAAKRGPTYQSIACDPPTTAINKDGSRFVVQEALPTLAKQCLQALLPGGVLLLSTNARQMRPADVVRAAQEGADAAGRPVRVQEVPLPPDLPSCGDPRLDATKPVLVTVR